MVGFVVPGLVLVLLVLLGIGRGFDIKFRSMEDASKGFTLTIDKAGQPETITAAVDAFIQAYPEVRGEEAHIRKLVERRMEGIGIKERTDADGICGNLISDVDASILHDFARIAIKQTISPGDDQTVRYAETGSYLGCSSIIMASVLPPRSLIYAHDLWVDSRSGEILAEEGDPPEMIEDYFYHFVQNVRSRGLERTIIPIRGNSSYTLGMHEPESLNMGFIDGDHSYEGVQADLRAMYPLIKRGGALLLHDVMNTGEIINPAGAALKDFCLEERGRVCDFMVSGTEIARVHKD